MISKAMADEVGVAWRGVLSLYHFRKQVSYRLQARQRLSIGLWMDAHALFDLITFLS